MIRLRTSLIAFLIISSSILAASRIQAAPFQGRVVDAETDEPLEGAVIVIKWDRGLFVPCMDSCTAFYSAVESVTQFDGTFAIDLSRPWLAVRKTAQIYKPGYKITGLWRLGTEDKPLPDEPTIRLVKLKSLRDHVSDYPNFSVCSETPIERNRWCVPPEDIPHYVRLHSLQWKIFGSQGQ